jgi:DNA polymerase-3 subunit gamma/tau
MPNAESVWHSAPRTPRPRIRHSSFTIWHSAFSTSALAYQVLARKWRPQQFADVIGQRGVTETLRNAIATKRIAQSFVFAGPRGVGKTTTARILARALNCERGPSPDPCGQCDACVEIAEGRDIDVLEIDAATHTQVDKVRDIIVSGLGVVPVRDRYKVFIIDEVHRFSPQSFDALLKSIEEPPPHVVFMMATTELEKVPATIQSRSQVFELKTIGVKAIADQLRRIAGVEKIDVDEAALMLVARAGDGSMRDAQSALDQVIGFASGRITADDVTTVLGLVRRDLLIEIAGAVAREDAPALFELAGRTVESGYDLRLVIRELARLTRDLLVLSVDPSRVADPEIAADAEREPLLALARQFSGEDLMRAFDVLTKAEYDIRTSSQPRYHLEMALLRWIHLRRLVPLTELIENLEKRPARAVAIPAPAAPPRIERRTISPPPAPMASAPARPEPVAVPPPSAPVPASAPAAPSGPRDFKDVFLDEIRRAKKAFHSMVIAQAQRIDVDGDRIVFTFSPTHRTLRVQVDQLRPWLESVAGQIAGRRMSVQAVEGTAARSSPQQPGAPPAEDRRQALKEQALSDSGVQAMLDVFAAEIKDVEEM